MIDPYVVTLATAIMVLLAALCVGLHEILLSPDLPNYPNAHRHVRLAMFVWMVCLGYRGVEMLSLLFTSRVLVTPGSFWASFAAFWVHAVLLEQQLRRWLPARLHERIRRLLAIASCRARPALAAERARNLAAVRPGVAVPITPVASVGPALATLALEGARVIGPNEPPEALKEL